jgi:hypothetical protein
MAVPAATVGLWTVVYRALLASPAWDFGHDSLGYYFSADLSNGTNSKALGNRLNTGGSGATKSSILEGPVPPATFIPIAEESGIPEGAKKEEQVALPRAYGCHELQGGYRYWHPCRRGNLPAARTTRLLRVRWDHPPTPLKAVSCRPNRAIEPLGHPRHVTKSTLDGGCPGRRQQDNLVCSHCARCCVV